MSRVAPLFTTLRGWSWLCAALAVVSTVPFALIVRSVEQQVHAQVASGHDGCRSCSFQVLAVIALSMSGAGLLVAMFGAGSFVRLSSPRPAARWLELLLAASAPFTLPAIGMFIAMWAMP